MVCYAGVAPRLKQVSFLYDGKRVFFYFPVIYTKKYFQKYKFHFESETANSLLLNHSLFLCNNYDHWINSCYCFCVGSIFLLQYLLTAWMPFSCFDSWLKGFFNSCLIPLLHCSNFSSLCSVFRVAWLFLRNYLSCDVNFYVQLDVIFRPNAALCQILTTTSVGWMMQ